MPAWHFLNAIEDLRGRRATLLLVLCWQHYEEVISLFALGLPIFFSCGLRRADFRTYTQDYPKSYLSNYHLCDEFHIPLELRHRHQTKPFDEAAFLELFYFRRNSIFLMFECGMNDRYR